MKVLKMVAILSFLFLQGCASSLMKPADGSALVAPPGENSRVVFLRPSSFGGAIQASLFDITGDETRFIGVSSTGTQVVYDVAPGRHRFMVVSEAADFMEAELSPGQTYYAVVTPRMGAWKARFSLWPIKAASENEFNWRNADVAKWIANARHVQNTPEGEAWFNANRASIIEKQVDYLVVWNKKSAADLAQRTLAPGDAFAAKP